jgi:hypothetical protein
MEDRRVRTRGRCKLRFRATRSVTRIHNPAALALRDGQFHSKAVPSARVYDRAKSSPAMRRALEAVAREFE